MPAYNNEDLSKTCGYVAQGRMQLTRFTMVRTLQTRVEDAYYLEASLYLSLTHSTRCHLPKWLLSARLHVALEEAASSWAASRSLCATKSKIVQRCQTRGSLSREEHPICDYNCFNVIQYA